MNGPSNSKPIQQPNSGVKLAIRVGGNHLLFISDDVLAGFPGMNCFEVTCEEGRIVLAPLQQQLPSLEEVRNKIADLGITEADVAAAVAEARRQGG